jgi:hypothetical protein
MVVTMRTVHRPDHVVLTVGNEQPAVAADECRKVRVTVPHRWPVISGISSDTGTGDRCDNAIFRHLRMR